MDRALSQSLTPAEGEMAEAELEELEADYARLEAAEELPSVPKVGSFVTLVVFNYGRVAAGFGWSRCRLLTARLCVCCSMAWKLHRRKLQQTPLRRGTPCNA